jgi:RNA polymerase sigma-70 factor, ECF subfamily
MPCSLARALLAHVAPDRAANVPPEHLERILREALAEVERAAPGLAVDDAFGQVLAGRLPPDEPVVDAIARVRVADLALAWGCALGDPRALAAFEPVLTREVELAGARIGAPAVTVDEGKQVVRTILLTAAPGRTPAIASYAGRGDLRAWVRVVALRELVRLQKAARHDEALEDDVLYDMVAPHDAPELAHIEALYRQQLSTAFRDAVRALPSRDRLLLRQQCLDGLSIDDLAPLHGVHRATVARWIAKTRQTLLAQTRKGLMERLGIDRADADSLLRLLQNRLDLTLESALATRTTVVPPVR